VEEARKKIHLVDSKGLITKGRSVGGLSAEKDAFAHDGAECLLTNPEGLTGIVKQVKPTILIGVSAIAQVFTQSVIEAMAEMNEVPMIMALSNPTSKAECTAQQVRLLSARICYRNLNLTHDSPFFFTFTLLTHHTPNHTTGVRVDEGQGHLHFRVTVRTRHHDCKCLIVHQLHSFIRLIHVLTHSLTRIFFHSLLQVDGVETTLHPGQGNNSYIFPGVALGVLCSGAKRVTDSMFLVAAQCRKYLFYCTH
jgi:hypothetical protein